MITEQQQNGSPNVPLESTETALTPFPKLRLVSLRAIRQGTDRSSTTSLTYTDSDSDCCQTASTSTPLTVTLSIQYTLDTHRHHLFLRLTRHLHTSSLLLGASTFPFFHCLPRSRRTHNSTSAASSPFIIANCLSSSPSSSTATSTNFDPSTSHRID